jgi:hypothetical protein
MQTTRIMKCASFRKMTIKIDGRHFTTEGRDVKFNCGSPRAVSFQRASSEALMCLEQKRHGWLVQYTLRATQALAP